MKEKRAGCPCFEKKRRSSRTMDEERKKAKRNRRLIINLLSWFISQAEGEMTTGGGRCSCNSCEEEQEEEEGTAMNGEPLGLQTAVGGDVIGIEVAAEEEEEHNGCIEDRKALAMCAGTIFSTRFMATICCSSSLEKSNSGGNGAPLGSL